MLCNMVGMVPGTAPHGAFLDSLQHTPWNSKVSVTSAHRIFKSQSLTMGGLTCACLASQTPSMALLS